MATRIRRIPRAGQPPSGIEAQSQWAAAFNFSNSAIDLAGGVGEFASLPAAGFTSGPEGIGLEFATSNVSTASSRITPGITDAITAVMVIEPVGSATANSNFLFGEAAASIGNYNWGFYSNSSGYPTVFVHNGTTGVAAIYTFYVWQNVRRPQTWVMTYGGGDNNIRLFVDGLVASSAAQTGNIRRDANAHLGFQRWNTVGANCRLYAAGVLPRCISQAEAMALSSGDTVRSVAWNELFGSRRVPLPVSAGGGISLVVADALHAHAADNVVLTSQTAITIADALHAHAADNVVLTSQTAITIADALHAHAADNVVLTSATAITIADALHAHAADNVVLTSATAITIADALHAHAADNVVLTSATAITIADALHAHAADNVVLQIAGATNLTVADALHAHAADNVVLTSQIAIVVADALHAHTVDGLTLTAASVLALQDALHAHAADNLTLELSGGITLTLADALHAHTADGVLLTVSAYLVVSDALHAHAADNILLSIPGAFRAGNPRVWILDSRQRYSMVDSRRRVVHLN